MAHKFHLLVRILPELFYWHWLCGVAVAYQTYDNPTNTNKGYDNNNNNNNKFYITRVTYLPYN